MAGKTIVVPLDGSSFSRAALPCACALVRAAGGRLLLVRVVDDLPAPHSDESLENAELIAEARAELGPLAEGIRGDGYAVDWLVTPGEAASTILEAATAADAWLIVMATHGRSGLGRWIYGSVADAVLRDAPVPVLMVPPGCTVTWARSGRFSVLVALDGSDFAEEALGPADAIASCLNGAVSLLRVVEPPPSSYEPPFGTPTDPSLFFHPEQECADARTYLDAVTARRWSAGARDVATDVRLGDPAHEIVAAAHERAAGLIAMATHGRGGLRRAVLGSVATGTLQRASTPVLLVRPERA